MMNSGQIQLLTTKAHYWFRKNAIMQKGSLMKIPHLQVLKEKNKNKKNKDQESHHHTKEVWGTQKEYNKINF